MNPYKILGVNETTPFHNIRAAYRNMSAKYHPDKNGDSEEIRLKFFEINEAFKKIKHEIEELYNFLGLPKDADPQAVTAAYNLKHDKVKIALRNNEPSAKKDSEKLKKIHNIIMSEFIEAHSHNEW